MDRLNLVDAPHAVGLRPIGLNGYTGRGVSAGPVWTLLAGGDFLTDVDLLRGEATQALHGLHALPSHDS